MPLHFFLTLKVQLVVLVSTFVMVNIQFGQFLFAVLLLTVSAMPYGVGASVHKICSCKVKLDLCSRSVDFMSTAET